MDIATAATMAAQAAPATAKPISHETVFNSQVRTRLLTEGLVGFSFFEDDGIVV
jgi:hypothetical protein